MDRVLCDYCVILVGNERPITLHGLLQSFMGSMEGVNSLKIGGNALH